MLRAALHGRLTDNSNKQPNLAPVADEESGFVGFPAISCGCIWNEGRPGDRDSLPDYLLHEAVGVVGREGGEGGASRHALLEAHQLGVGRKERWLVDVHHRDSDPRCGLQG